MADRSPQPIDDVLTGALTGAAEASTGEETAVLAFGAVGASSVVVGWLEDRGIAVQVVEPRAGGDWASLQLDRRASVVVVGSSASTPPEQRAAQLHCAVQHVEPGGLVITDVAADLTRFDLSVIAVWHGEGGGITISRRTDRVTVHDLVVAARSRIERVSADELARRLGRDRPPFVIDTRTHTDRARFGVIPGSTHIPRTVLEWHLDPANGYRHAAAPLFDDEIVVVCNGGYSSSLAAANLVSLGFTKVADLIGGHHAWRNAGLPVVEPDHSHLDL